MNNKHFNLNINHINVTPSKYFFHRSCRYSLFWGSVPVVLECYHSYDIIYICNRVLFSWWTQSFTWSLFLYRAQRQLTGTTKFWTHCTHLQTHSLLHDTQEGWSRLDDEATKDTLCKLDGISGKSVWTGASTGSFSRSTSMSKLSSTSHPVMLAKAESTVQWEGIEGHKSSQSGSAHARESTANRKDKPRRGICNLS